ncbi:uncharacterized protein K02A2.6-like [Ixodes scapularis]|uniref:uncharacterized protein K02A2.6-like n=1 Tax=Ixodes scapularis TaxID=6945 RepID=UPI001A9E3F2B|nr:uncharacterized protein K02A2.6-like [Ixodes scapularis]
MPYFDDILVASRTQSDHATHLRKVLEIARNNNLKLNKDKLKLGLSTVTYLGHQLTQEGIAPDPEKTIKTVDEEHGVLVCTLVHASTAKLAEIQASTAADEVLKRVTTYIEHGWPNKISKVHPSVRTVYSRRSELYITDGFICYGERLVVPEACKKDVISRLHMTHRGIVACKNLASQSVFWPRINQDIEELISSCEVCQRHQRANQREPLLDRDLPIRPWEKVAMDFFYHGGTTYLLVVDYYSKFVEVKKMSTTTASALISVLKELYACHGIPSEVVSDQGPPFDSLEYRSFNKEWDIVHNPSSPLFPRSNGQAEQTIQTIKATMTKALSEGKDLALVLMTYRATPKEPASLVLAWKKLEKSSCDTEPPFVSPMQQTRHHKLNPARLAQEDL